MTRYIVIPKSDFPEYEVEAENSEEALNLVKEMIVEDDLEVPELTVLEIPENCKGALLPN